MQLCKNFGEANIGQGWLDYMTTRCVLHVALTVVVVALAAVALVAWAVGVAAVVMVLLPIKS